MNKKRNLIRIFKARIEVTYKKEISNALGGKKGTSGFELAYLFICNFKRLSIH